MMDVLIPIVENPRDHYDLMPAYRVRCLAQILYASMIKALSAVDCGEVFRKEWTARNERLRTYLREGGGFLPDLMHGKHPALDP